jgi:ribonuclease VapC
VAEPTAVLDASALLAWLHLEPGALAVRAALDNTAAMSVVNWAEVLTKLADLGQDPVEVRSKMLKDGLFEKDLLLWPLNEAMAVEIANLRAKTRSRGFSLGDRACIALGRHLRLPVVTSDQVWKTLRLGVQVQLIR